MDGPFFNGTKPPGMPSTSVLPALCAAESDCLRRRFINAGLPSNTRAAFARLRSEALSPRARSSCGRIAQRQFSQSRLRAALARWSRCSEPWWDFSRLQPMELVFSQRADSNRDGSAHAQNIPANCWMAAGLIQIENCACPGSPPLPPRAIGLIQPHLRAKMP